MGVFLWWRIFKSTKQSITRPDGAKTCALFVLPFCPLCQDQWLLTFRLHYQLQSGVDVLRKVPFWDLQIGYTLFQRGLGFCTIDGSHFSKQLTSRPRKPVTMGEEMTFEKMCDTMGIPPNFRGGKKLIKRFYSKRKYVHKHWLLLPSGYLYQTPLRLFLWSCCDCKHFSPSFPCDVFWFSWFRGHVLGPNRLPCCTNDKW